MEIPRIYCCDSWLRLVLSTKEVYEKKVSELERIYCIISGSDVFSNDSVSFLFVFDSEAWLLPKYTPGLRDLKGDFAIFGGSLVVTIDYLPRRWRKGFWLFRGIEPKIGVYGLEDFDLAKANFRVHSECSASDYL
ncbi:hypothetical protein [Marinobacter sp. CA1]|uniref:hypothetical protein n=1 Tax=Marinobacter sp. CA1 TaxID=2817656 RepID=UPI001D090470|nr:hypothetical protein [Marinobacter sp. CA1]UDL05321.1 hypothetical protein J2887_00615 [Marinobacter sp. CA1]